jgi:hypothetical protein
MTAIFSDGSAGAEIVDFEFTLDTVQLEKTRNSRALGDQGSI